ncbi:MAG TPA: ABC transporter C-terminal domain-containing protein, partial [Bryobacteraceae bacterium]|nr:ABC transporter C-terminal domain-containing protein [Bryobacteraceae bacterium]
KEWDKMEAMIEKAEAAVLATQKATEDPAVMSNAGELRTRYAALEAAQTAVERLYARWAELEEKRTQG